METTSFNVPSISCSACAEKIQEGLKEMKGVGNVSVDLKTKMVNVDYNPADVKPQDIIGKVSSLGYEVSQ
ncbi:heavy metal transporter [Clostridium thermosuccinogenes]|jgi:Cu+-exporting ATPase|uniref:Heavy metal transporter n=1 Tax=Clostridium thermosuccinogenes TaxID=84032 RepID=A0A2K2FJQ3_9CLOT|nr:heavy metal-associated domain-containing protein [Pseudoclostridium thermosuccinogenes]AUS98464.1 heavy metal transporter [Pseudoclostridium thermosuccinogenes]PNT90870.1 heavy metal transporter [Pseudoclostridium thermosuccinogenes]PNT97083.1 heavy metal transporter [Pseudoclostridium thermosuccinogenes]PNT99014.1 heavy metal transporter [Pseudoclostridium thermosuccinogenes]